MPKASPVFEHMEDPPGNYHSGDHGPQSSPSCASSNPGQDEISATRTSAAAKSQTTPSRLSLINDVEKTVR